MIRSLNTLIKHTRALQELLLRQKANEDIVECIDITDTMINTLHGLREEQEDKALFEGNFRLDDYSDSALEEDEDD